MATVRRNERSWAISLISDINLLLKKYTLNIKRAGGETTISSGNTRMFPDVILYSDEAQTHIIQGWELKLPDTPITDETFIQDAWRKANVLGLNSCFIWNFTAGVLYVKNDEGQFVIERQWNQTNHIKTRSDVELYKSDWMPLIEKIILEINDLFSNQRLASSSLGNIISTSVIAKIIGFNKKIVAEHLKRTAFSDAVMSAHLDLWWKSVKEEYVSDENDAYIAYAKILLLNWTNRITFAHLIKSHHNAAFQIEELTEANTPEDANRIFESITALCDFYNIFHTEKYNAVLPKDTWDNLLEFNSFLTENNIGQIEQTALQYVLENTVNVSKRELSGQFTTPPLLADILTQITVIDYNKNCADPCCGTGTIAAAIQQNKVQRSGNINHAVETTWASDKYAFPLQIAQISLTNTDTMTLASRIFKNNVLELNAGMTISITNPSDGSVMDLELQKFGAIVTNLPFIPFEIINTDDKAHLDSIAAELKQKCKITFNKKSDFYSYIPFKLWHLLDKGGRLGIITSNSWLGTSAGLDFFNALTQYYHLEQVHISGVGRWFDNAQVVTVLSIFNKKDIISKADKSDTTAFCIWNTTLAQLSESGDDVDCIIKSSLLNQEFNNKIIRRYPYTRAAIDDFLSMGLSLNALFHDVSWLRDIKNKLCKITDVFTVMRGERRGWDKLFYPEEGHGIEPDYIRPVLMNSKSLTGLVAVAESEAFCCSATKAALQANNDVGTLAWIAKFENEANNTGKPLTQVLKKPNMEWYEMTDASAADIVTSMNPDKRLFYSAFHAPAFINQRLIGLKAQSGTDIELSHALLNSILGMFFIEAIGFGRGLGALDINSTTLRQSYMLNPRLLTSAQRQKILDAFKPLLQRDVLSTTKELATPDRISFEHAVLEAFGIVEYYDKIKSSLLSMQKARQSVR